MATKESSAIGEALNLVNGMDEKQCKKWIREMVTRLLAIDTSPDGHDRYKVTGEIVPGATLQRRFPSFNSQEDAESAVRAIRAGVMRSLKVKR